ncbi:DUF421 domain-containing protein [Metabacillus halosaccharovorans]|uniref:DUF421 domain-containing protein n=1 Tax=Metabacillus halosaccharovorans TaxID=930124 RepID=UPI001C1F9FC9|nr:DUF421 domain-containing protein [Metabacillus halosaccharovorans]MBU7591070.1 DUF421 domain-containing protein [Metabacillus halosaccharovorans]
MPDWIEVVIRSFCIIGGLFLITKLLGKKQLSKLSFFEYIVGITVGDIAGTITMDIELNILNGVVSILIWTLFPLVISHISLKSKKFRDVVEGKATTFIQDGKILEENLKYEKYSTDELLEQLRKKNIFQVSDVEFAILETNGELSVLLKKEKQPTIWEDFFGEGPKLKTPLTIIMDGNYLESAIYEGGYSLDWVRSKLQEKKRNVKDVFLAQLDSDGNLYADYYDDQLKKPETGEKK